MVHVTVLGPQRRRRWSKEERLQILQEAFAEGGCPTETMRRHDVSSSLLYTWRRKLREACEPGFAEAIPAEETAVMVSSYPVIVVDVPPNRRVSIYGSAPPRLVVAALRALR